MAALNLPKWLKDSWKEAAILALIAALVLELGINLLSSRTVWHRLTALEHSVQELQHERELDELKKDK